MTRKEYEGTPARRIDQGNGLVDDRCDIARPRRLRHSNRQIQQALALVVERTIDLQRGSVSEPETAGEVAEILAQRKRRRREHPRATPRPQHTLKPSRNVKRHETQCEAPLARL